MCTVLDSHEEESFGDQLLELGLRLKYHEYLQGNGRKSFEEFSDELMKEVDASVERAQLRPFHTNPATQPQIDNINQQFAEVFGGVK